VTAAALGQVSTLLCTWSRSELHVGLRPSTVIELMAWIVNNRRAAAEEPLCYFQ